MDMEARTSFSDQLAALVGLESEPQLRELYASCGGEIQALLRARCVDASPKSIIVHGVRQYLGDAHAELVIEQVLEMTPSEYMRAVESLRLVGCGFMAHELFNDGHVCKEAARTSYLDCAHSIARKVLETALALVVVDSSPPSIREASGSDPRFATFCSCDDGLVRFDRAIGEIARGPIRHDTMRVFAEEAQLLDAAEPREHADLMRILPALRPRLQERQGEYARPLLQLACDVAPDLFQILRRRLVDWLERADRAEG